jgi:hypothetical protein
MKHRDFTGDLMGLLVCVVRWDTPLVFALVCIVGTNLQFVVDKQQSDVGIKSCDQQHAYI